MAACAAPEVAPVRALSLLDGAAVAQGPSGFCVRPEVSRPETGFAVMAPCPGAEGPTVGSLPATLLTVQFGPVGSASVDGAEAQMVDLLRSVEGFRLLSFFGRPETVTILSTDTRPGLVLLRLRDDAPPLAPGLSAQELRAFVDIDGRLTTVTLRELDRGEVAERNSEDLVIDTIAALRAANPPA
jgi:hypothetical protein